MAKITLLRHAAVHGDGRLYSAETGPMSASAFEVLPPMLISECFTHILVSPTDRTRLTANWLKRALMWSEPLRELELLGPQDWGDWTGRKPAEVGIRGEDRPPYWLVDHDVSPPNGESFVDICARAEKFLQGLVTLDGSPGGGDSVLAVTHGEFIRAMIVTALAMEPATARMFDVPPLGSVILRKRDSWGGGWFLCAR